MGAGLGGSGRRGGFGEGERGGGVKREGGGPKGRKRRKQTGQWALRGPEGQRRAGHALGLKYIIQRLSFNRAWRAGIGGGRARAWLR